ncbi:MAG: DUF1573 domain-containing protein [Blastochloris sp.]|nr:DUF1573 domain-containing protein [Blastochloris sp.]
MKQRTFRFEVKNVSKRTVDITSVEKSCGCTEVKAGKATLKSGESTTLTGTLAAQDRIGEFGSTIQVNLSDGSYAQAHVGGKAVNVLQGPTHLDLGETFVDETPASKTFTFLKGEDEEPWDDLRLRSGGLKTNIIRRGNAWLITLTPPRAEETGVFREDISIECWKSGAWESATTIPLTATWKIHSRNVQITPMAAYFGVMKREEEKSVRLKVKTSAGNAVRLVKAEFPVGMIASANLVEDQNQFYLEIRAKSLPLGDGQQSEFLRVLLSTSGNNDWHRIRILGNNRS